MAGESIKSEEVLIDPRYSDNGAGIAQQGQKLWAYCPACMKVLGFKQSFGAHGGDWMCMRGCGKVYYNAYGMSTSSIFRDVREENNGKQFIVEWLSGWLGVPADQIKVTVS
jgi:hypothetical protein